MEVYVTQFRIILSVVMMAVFTIYPKSSSAEPPIFATNNVAIGGYDAVAYFLDEKAVKGQLEYSYRWQNVDWWFISQQHRDLFVQSPESYQPMFGGFCGLGAAHGALVPADPEAWTIHNGRLLLNQDKEVTKTWRYNPETNIRRAQTAYNSAIARYLKQQENSKLNSANNQEGK
jgi:hypothetical protein